MYKKYNKSKSLFLYTSYECAHYKVTRLVLNKEKIEFHNPDRALTTYYERLQSQSVYF